MAKIKVFKYPRTGDINQSYRLARRNLDDSFTKHNVRGTDIEYAIRSAFDLAQSAQDLNRHVKVSDEWMPNLIRAENLLQDIITRIKELYEVLKVWVNEKPEYQHLHSFIARLALFIRTPL